MKTLKQLLDQVNGEAGFDIPDLYFGSTDPNIVQLTSIANRSAIILRDLHLQFLTKQATIALANGSSTDNAQIKSYALPEDFYALVPDTTYQFGRIDPAQLPTTASTWAYLRSRTGPQGLRIRCRILNNRLYVFSPEVSQHLDFEYYSKFPIQGSPNGNPAGRAVSKEQFGFDNDQWLLDDALIELDIIWRYKKAKGVEDWPQDQAIFESYKNELRGRDSGARTISWNEVWPYPNEPYANLWVQ